MRVTEINYGGNVYIKDEYTTAAKRKNLPEKVKKAILGKDYVEPEQVFESEPTGQIVE